MTREIVDPREETYKALLEVFATATGLPIGLFEKRGGQTVGIFSKTALENFEPYCKLIQSFPEGRIACEIDHCQRASRALQKGEAWLTLCYAGLYNEAIPIKVDGEARAVLLYGQMRIADKEHEELSLKKHQEAVTRLGLTKEQAAQLRDLLLKTKQYSTDEFEALKATFPNIAQWLYRLIDAEEKLTRHVEKVTHELQTRLQAVLAIAENLYYDMLEVPKLRQDLKNTVNEVLNSALALDTIVQSLGEFLEEYHFEKRLIEPLLYEAKRIYKAEAARKRVSIYIKLEPVNGKPPSLEISASHLQRAINNMVHNAVKYSFYGGDERRRYVRIMGRNADHDHYSITIESYGVGILPEEIETGAIFRNGYQGKLTHGEYRTGAGKGLYFAKQVIERHHGWIEVSSKQMGGEENPPEKQPHLNRFTIYLPYRQPREKMHNG